MITFSNLGRYGRLGNQLFQISSTIGIAKENECEFIFPKWICSYSNRNYSDYFKNKLPEGNITNLQTYKEVNFNYNPIVINDKEKNIDILGYFQSEKYFKKYRNQILYYFEFESQILNSVENKYRQFLSNSCSLHIRRGDYLNLGHVYKILSLDYYYNSIESIYNDISNVNFFIFSDDLIWCKENINLPNLIFIDINDEMLELYLMSRCQNNIIANSSYSWWGSWLNKNENKKVVAPKNWFNDGQYLNSNDIYCENWTVI